jgi:phenylalanine-4-hydroxylase
MLSRSVGRLRRLAPHRPAGILPAARGMCDGAVAARHERRSDPRRVGRPQTKFKEPEQSNKLGLVFQTSDEPGALEEVLKLFRSNSINLTRIESRPSKIGDDAYDFHVDLEGSAEDPSVERLLASLKDVCLTVEAREPKLVPWFPRKIADLDQFSNQTLDAGVDLEADHPGFTDEAYRRRRKEIVESTQDFSFAVGGRIPDVAYNEQETETWGVVYERLGRLLPHYACKQYNYILPLMEKNCGYARDNIPQVQDISDFLKECTGFQLRPVGGLLSARDFLNGLAFRVFFSTQYIRHHSTPLYTPEPDICHELMGHAPMFADPDFADFSHEIGLASLGASDADIKRLATCYWFSVEFGLCRQDGGMKAYGAGLLSSFGELEYACSAQRPAGGVDMFPTYLPWEPDVAASQEYPITTYQPTYFVADSLSDAKERMRQFADSLSRPFRVRYDPYSQSVPVDRAVKRGEYRVTLQSGESRPAGEEASPSPYPE